MKFKDLWMGDWFVLVFVFFLLYFTIWLGYQETLLTSLVVTIFALLTVILFDLILVNITGIKRNNDHSWEGRLKQLIWFTIGFITTIVVLWLV